MSHSKTRAAGSIVGISLLLQVLTAGAAFGTAPKDAQFFKKQWNLKAISAHAGGVRDAEAQAADAEDAGEVLVAVVDMGINWNHPDLGIARNADGTPGDGGRVDLQRSTSLIGPRAPAGSTCLTVQHPHESGVVAGQPEPGTPYGANRTMQPIDEEAEADNLGQHRAIDFHSHGTGVAGLIASNGVLLAGITERTTLFSVKVHGISRQNCVSKYIAGIYEAADRGADVIHLSYPLEWSTTDTRFDGVAAVARVNAALDYAHEQGAVIVAAAGNGGTDSIGDDLDVGPTFRFCEGNWVICVSATGTDSDDTVEEPYWDEPTVYTNFGSSIDVAGPGGTAAVPVWITCSTDTRFGGAPQAPCRPPANEKVWRSTGTTFGAAATSGLLALIVRLTGSDDPCVIEGILEQSADDLGDPGPDDFFGEGRINVKEAVMLAKHPGSVVAACD